MAQECPPTGWLWIYRRFRACASRSRPQSKPFETAEPWDRVDPAVTYRLCQGQTPATWGNLPDRLPAATAILATSLVILKLSSPTFSPTTFARNALEKIMLVREDIAPYLRASVLPPSSILTTAIEPALQSFLQVGSHFSRGTTQSLYHSSFGPRPLTSYLTLRTD